MSKYIFKAPNILSILIIIPALLMAVMPWTVESKFNIDLLGYECSLFFLIGLLAMILMPKYYLLLSKQQKVEIILIVYLFITFISSLLSSDISFFTGWMIGIEFLLGYFFAKNIVYNKVIIKFIRWSSLLILLIILFQQTIFSFGLGWFESGAANNVEVLDGVLRVGTSVGGSTFTGIYVVLLIGILLGNTRHYYIDIFYLFIGLISVTLSGTRSAMIILIFAFIYLLFNKHSEVPKLYKCLSLMIIGIYIFPIIVDMFQSRSQEALRDTGDITSGRVVRWKFVFDYMNRHIENYIFGFGGGSVPISSFNVNVNPLASPHNAYLGILFQFGLFGFTLFISFLFSKVKSIVNKINTSVIILLGSLFVSFNSEVVTLNFLYSFYFWMLYYKIIIDLNEKNCIYKCS